MSSEGMVSMDALPPSPTYAEKYDLAYGFVKSYFGGQVSVAFSTTEEIHDAKESGRLAAMQWAKSFVEQEQAADITRFDDEAICALEKKFFQHNASIIYGTTKATEDERKKAVDWILDYLWSLRSVDSVKGQFWAVPDMEKRVGRLEEDLRQHMEHLKELRILINAYFTGQGQQHE